MATNFQYRLQQLESSPPADSWKHIADRLDEEYHVEDVRLAEKMTMSGQPAPAGLWGRISNGLDTPALPVSLEVPAQVSVPAEVPVSSSSEARIIRFPSRRIAVAATAVILLGIFTAWYFAGSNSERQQQIVKTPDTGAQPPAELLNQDNVNSAGLVAAVPVFRVPKFRQQARPGKNIVSAVARNISDDDERYSEQDMDYSDIDKTEKGAETDPIAVPNNPIRDAEGKIIMDEQLVSAPDVNYVTVTGPNGEQTKISKKFMHALSYMNSGNTEDDYLGVMMQEGSLWKWLFQEWRTKLLKQPSFIPTATNFLDIMELKEILHENF